MSKTAFKNVRRRLGLTVSRQPVDAFAWPGGYPLYYICKDGGALCPDCVNANIDLINVAPRDDDTQWDVIGCQANYEDDSLHCDHCSKQIESAYGDSDEDQPESTG